MTWLDTLIDVLGGGKSASGVTITHENALSIAAVFTCVRVISGTIGALPMHVYRAADDDGREFAKRHWAYTLLHDSPNPYHTAMTWRELMTAHILLWGNSYNRIEWLGNGAAAALYPLMPWSVQPKLTKGGAKFYEVRLGAGREELPDYEVLHVPGLSYDGMQGLSVVTRMRDSLGLAKGAEDFAAQFFANGARIGGILETPGRMNEMAQKRLVESIAERYAGRTDAFKVLVLEQGAKWHGGLTMPLKDAEFLELRRFQRSEIFGWYGLPPHLGGDTERSTSWGTGIEQQDLGYSKHTITPLCVRIEQEINRKLFGRGSDFYCKHNLDGLQRGDFLTRMQGLQIAVGRPFMTVNEARTLSDMNRMADAGYDEIAIPLNTGVGATAPGANTDGSRSATPNITILPMDGRTGEQIERGLREGIASIAGLRDGIDAAIAHHRDTEASCAIKQLAAATRDAALEVHAAVQTMRDTPPPSVHVELPARRAVSEVERNGAGDITRITQIERDA